MPQNPKTRIENIVAKFFAEDAVMLGAYCLMDKVEDTTIKTVAIDVRGVTAAFRYNPAFIDAVTDEILELVLVSEGFKVLLHHPTTRLRQPKEISNLSSQLTINSCIMDKAPDFAKSTLDPAKFGIENFKEDGYYELIFRKLMEDLDGTMQKLSQMGFKPPEKGDGQPQNGQGNGQGDSQDGQGQGNAPQTQQQAIKDYMNPLGDNGKYWGENDLFDADVRQTVDEHRGSTKDWGRFTGNAMSEILSANTPKISWKDILRRFATSVLTSKQYSSRMKVNRRYDLDAPGYRRKYTSKIMLGTDVSGSMSDEDLQVIFASVNSICKHCDLTFVEFDTEIKYVEKKFKRAKSKFKVHGRGGTDFQQIIDLASKSKIDGLIIATDGYANPPIKPAGTKVLWLMTTKNNKPPVEWGSVANFDRYENAH